MTSSLQKLQRLLRRLFRLDEPRDLDFGIHRVINLKRDRLVKYIETGLPGKIAKTLQKHEGEFDQAKRDAFERARIAVGGDANLDAAGNFISPSLANTPVGKEYLRTRAQIESVPRVEQMKDGIYDHLANFFARYECGGGDIVPRRFHSVRNRYALPHSGEEVLLHWANRDQYYIKSAALHHSVAFQAGGKRCRLQIAEIKDIPRDNNKDEGRFLFPQIAEAAADDSGDIVVPFVFCALNKTEQKRYAEFANGENGNGSKTQRGILAKADAELRKAAAKNSALRPLLTANAGGGESAFLRHARRFVRRNNEEFFIHRDLRKFLSEELDFYLKNEVLNAEELAGLNGFAVAARMVVFRVIREIADDIIDVLAEWEDLQKVLWEKKKFVLQTEYCATIGHILDAGGAPLLEDIAECEKQWAEWEAMGVNGEAAALFSGNGKGKREQRIAHLHNNPSLPIDTANFPPEFKDCLLAQFSDIDGATDGVLIHGENWQALNLIQGMYRGRVKCVYIDPPYNTDASAILYKNDYKHSSWLSMMDGRLRLTPALMTANGILCAAIDDEEQPFLRILLSSIFGKEAGLAVVRSNPAGRKTKGRFAPAHEYAMFWGMSEEAIPGSLEKTEKALARYPLKDKDGRFAWANFIRSGSNDKREDRPTLFYPIYVGADDGIRIPKMEWDDNKSEWRVLEKPKKGEVAVWPMGKNGERGVEKNWHRGHKRVVDEPNEYRVRRTNGGGVSIDFKTRMDENALPVTWWEKSEYASANQGAAMLKKLFGGKGFDFAKAVDLVEDCLRAAGLGKTDFALDYFAGSGTTAHAVVNLNREDGGRRKFILAEMGDYFNTVLLPRVKKIIYSPEWKNGKAVRPATREEFERGPRLVKYQRIESYEDALANIELKPDGLDMEKVAPRYALDFESQKFPTRLTSAGLDSPFSYTLELTIGSGQNKEKQSPETADLPETFAYLTGLQVRTRRVVQDGTTGGRRYLVQRGTRGKKDIAVVWRDTTDWTDADYAADRKIVMKLTRGAEQTLVNGNTTGKELESLNPLFAEAMFPEGGE